MLIKALSDYYDILAMADKVLPRGYSNVKIHYKVSLTAEGKIDEIMKCQREEEFTDKKGKVKVVYSPSDMVMPQRTEKPGIEANIIEHRPLYLFGLDLENENLSPEDRTSKAKKSHSAMIQANLDFIKELDSPVINAFRKFLLLWKPEEEIFNGNLLGLGKAYDKSGYTFCLSGEPEKLLHEDALIRDKWEKEIQKADEDNCEEVSAQCAITGEKVPIARIHNKIKGIYGGLATGSVLVGFNNPSENSYGNEQSYNSNISEIVMKKYTEALNFLLNSQKHKTMLQDMTIVYWAMNPKENCEDLFTAMLYGQSEEIAAEQMDSILENLMTKAKGGRIQEGNLRFMDKIDPDVYFYMVGLKPNSSRVAVKFVYRKRYADILWNIARFQNELQVSDNAHIVSVYSIMRELVSPKSKDDKVNPAMMTKIFEAMIYGRDFPTSLLQTMIRRVRTDTDIKISLVRAGVIKACINRGNLKEELKVGLNKEDCNQAYLCGRLFAVLEKTQQDASKVPLNRTIKDAYFSSASMNPESVFPKLIRLEQNHYKMMEKNGRPTGYIKMIQGEIINGIEGKFPRILSLEEQGRFIIGYQQQYQSFFEKHSKDEMEEK